MAVTMAPVIGSSSNCQTLRVVDQKRKTQRELPLFNRELGILAFNERVLAQAADAAVPLLERAEWMARLQRRLWAFDSEALARRCQTKFAEAKWVFEARLCGELATDLNRARGRKLIGTALEAGSQGNYAAALKALVEANAIVTLEAPQANVLLQAGVELNDAKAVELATQLLLARGVRPETIEGTKQRARAEHTLQKAFPADAADAGLPALNQP